MEKKAELPTLAKILAEYFRLAKLSFLSLSFSRLAFARLRFEKVPRAEEEKKTDRSQEEHEEPMKKFNLTLLLSFSITRSSTCQH